MSLSIKATYNGQTRRFSIPDSADFLDLKSHLSDAFSLTAPFTIAYRDEDADLVALTNSNEYHELRAIVAAHSLNPVRIQITDNNPTSSHRAPPAAAPAAAADSPPHSNPNQNPGPGPNPMPPPPPGMEGIFAGIAQIVAAARNAHTSAHRTASDHARAAHEAGADAHRRAHGAHHDHVHRAHREHGRRHGCGPRGRRGAAGPSGGMPFGFNLSGGGVRGGPGGPGRAFSADMLAAFAPLMATLAPLFAAFSSSAASVRSHLGSIAPATRDAFHALIARARAGGPPSEARLAAVAAALHAARDWVADTDNLPRDGPVPADRADALAAAVDASVRPAAGDPVADAAVALVRAGIADPAVLAALRDLRASGGLEFDVDMEGGEVGQNTTADDEEEEEEENRTPAETIAAAVAELGKDGAAAAPEPPLALGDRGPRVALLQHVLTQLGYMQPRMYARRAGRFGPNTRDAVRTFQREFSLSDSASEGVYDATTAASLMSVLEAQVPPNAATGGAAEAAGSGAGPSNAGDAATPTPPPAQG